MPTKISATRSGGSELKKDPENPGSHSASVLNNLSFEVSAFDIDQNFQNFILELVWHVGRGDLPRNIHARIQIKTASSGFKKKLRVEPVKPKSRIDA